jgi:hypothetical protein
MRHELSRELSKDTAATRQIQTTTTCSLIEDLECRHHLCQNHEWTMDHEAQQPLVNNKHTTYTWEWESLDGKLKLIL